MQTTVVIKRLANNGFMITELHKLLLFKIWPLALSAGKDKYENKLHFCIFVSPLSINSDNDIVIDHDVCNLP